MAKWRQTVINLTGPGAGWRRHVVLSVLMGAGLIYAAPVWAEGDCPGRPVRIVFVDRPAGTALRGSGPAFQESEPGFIVDEVRAAARKLGCPIQLSRAPQLRQLQQLDIGAVDFGVGFQATPERLQAWRFPVNAKGQPDPAMSIGASPVVWVTLQGRKAELEAAWKARRLQGRFGAIPSSGAARMAAAAGVPTQPVMVPNEVERLLQLGRYDAVALPLQMLDGIMQAKSTALASLSPPLGEMHYYVPASRRFYEQSESYVQAFWLALCEQAQRRPAQRGCLR